MTPKGMLDLNIYAYNYGKRIISTTDTIDEYTKSQKMISNLWYKF